MFKNPLPLNPSAHAQLRFTPLTDYEFSRHEMVAPVVASEIWPIAREYLLLFPKASGGIPLALLGTEPGVNEYVDSEPRWWGRYIPAHIRRYPFVAAPAQPQESGAEGQFVICIDADAPQLRYDSGQRLFDEEGKATAILQNIQNVLAALQQDVRRTTQLVREIEDAGLLAEQYLRLPQADGEGKALSGFRVVDTQQLQAASGEVLHRLMKTGALALVYAHIGSLQNLRDGLLTKKATGQLKTADTTAPNFIDLDDGDTLNFDWSRLH